MRMVKFAENKQGAFYAKAGHNKCNGGTGIQGYVTKNGVRVPILCSCVKLMTDKKEAANG
jgi:hypothetical protein